MPVENQELRPNRKKRRAEASIERRHKFYEKRQMNQDVLDAKSEARAQREANKRAKAAALRAEKAAKPSEAKKMKAKRLKEVAKVQARANKRRAKRLKDCANED